MRHAMLVLEYPTASYINLHNSSSRDELSTSKKGLLRNKVDKLVDLIVARCADRNLEEMADVLKEDTFNIRFDLLEWIVDEGLNNKDYLESIESNISEEHLPSHFGKLAKKVAKLLELYKKIIVQILDRISFPEILNSIGYQTPKYEALGMLSYHPNPTTSHIKDWMDSSLHLDIGLILSDLVLRGKVELSEEKIKEELIPFLDRTIIHFGAYSIFTKVYTPVDYWLDPDINRMYILATTFELDSKSHKIRDLNQVIQLLNN